MNDQSNTPDPERLLTKAELAERWKISVRVLEKWHKDGKGPRRIELGARRVFYKMADILSYEQQNMKGGAQ